MTHDTHDDTPLREMLRAATDAPPLADVDWDALHARTLGSAALLLRRRTRTWWQILGDGTLPSGRLAAAATIALVVIGGLLMPQRDGQAAAAEFRTIEEELAHSIPYGSVPLLAADADNGAVIDALLLYDEETW
jgi:hypothetical protein